MNDRLLQVFEHKARSSAEFRAVQRRHGLILCPDDMRADPETREGTQELHKGLHWINLEISEALHASSDTRLEELADVLHFLVELSILLGYDHTIVPGGIQLDRLDVMLSASEGDALTFPDFETNARFTILATLLVADKLKNKPWKQTIKPVPHEAIREAVQGIYYWYGATVRSAGYSAEDLFNAFVSKEEVNHNRVASGV